MQLHFEPPGEPPFEVKQERRISLFVGQGGVGEGARVQVKYDTANKQHVVILGDSDTTPSPVPARRSGSAAAYETESPGAALARNLTDLSHLHKSGELRDAEFEAAKKKLLG